MGNKIGTFTKEKNVVMNNWAPFYDTLMKVYTLGREKKLRNCELDIANIKKGDNVLEIGCGTGTLTILAKERAGSSGKVFGIDAASEMIKVAKRKAKSKKVEIMFQVGDICNLPFEDNSFDYVLCSFMIFHISSEKRRDGLQDIFRVLKDNGTFVIVDILKEEGRKILLDSMYPVFSDIESGYKKLGFLVPQIAFMKGKAKK